MKALGIFLILASAFANCQTDKTKTMMNNSKEIATLGAGCFWCVEAIFARVDGVEEVISGYSGGHVKNPSYKEVTSGNTGHAEVCQLTFDSSKISYSEILDIFFQTHNPTTLNRQGADVGTQYRSVIFYHSDQQKQIALERKEKWNNSEKFTDPVVTEITRFEAFYEAEGYHQDYFENNPYQPYCSFVIEPKVKKFMKEFKPMLKLD